VRKEEAVFIAIGQDAALCRKDNKNALHPALMITGLFLMDKKIQKAIIRQVEAEPFSKKFNLRLIDVQEGYAKVAMLFTADMENIFGMAHGGALFSLIDEAFEIASNSHGTMAVALNMNINYIASPSKGACLTAEAKELNKTRKTATYDIRVHDEHNNLIVTCQALVYRKDKPLPFLD